MHIKDLTIIAIDLTGNNISEESIINNYGWDDFNKIKLIRDCINLGYIIIKDLNNEKKVYYG